MKNIIYYYYHIKLNQINNHNQNYYFYFNNNLYYFLIYNRNPNNINAIYDLSKSLHTNIISTIIKNKDNNIITTVDNLPYVLLKINQHTIRNINIKDINYISKLNFIYINSLLRDNWNILWSKKIDYLEYQINQIGRKYPVIVDSFSYFVGLAENAISYYQNTIDNYPKQLEKSYCICHDKIRINDNTLNFYNPLNIIIDHKSRDLGEYIKISFFKQNYNIFDELDLYFKNNYYNEYDFCLLISRLLYPSFYFDLYDDIINNVVKEEDITYISSNINAYENYLKDILTYLDKYYKLPNIEWLNN